jgi:hypothetical protein
VVQESNWSETGTAGQPFYGYIATFNVPELTQQMVSSGMILVYRMQNTGTGSVIAYSLPSVEPNGEYERTIQFFAEVGKLTIEVYDTDLQTTRPPSLNFRVVLLPGISIGKNLDFTNYEAVKAHYNIIDLSVRTLRPVPIN